MKKVKAKNCVSRYSASNRCYYVRYTHGWLYIESEDDDFAVGEDEEEEDDDEISEGSGSGSGSDDESEEKEKKHKKGELLGLTNEIRIPKNL